MNETRLKSLMGFCTRAGQGIFGEESCRKALQSGKAGLLLLDEGISEGSGDRLTRLCAARGVSVCRLPEGFLEEATGRPGKTMAVPPGNFSEQMIRCTD